jgi:hypothetical protein
VWAFAYQHVLNPAGRQVGDELGESGRADHRARAIAAHAGLPSDQGRIACQARAPAVSTAHDLIEFVYELTG